MTFQSVKGFRDFYPEQMAVRNFIADAWRRVSLRNGFVEYDGPILEYLDLYRVKSGDEIVSQLFSLTDRGGRELALRPEITPTLARMVNAKINSLPRPIKWFSIPQLCRAENPQKGRGREFFQWNIDVVGSDDVLADAECIFTLADLLAEVGLSPSDAHIGLSSRAMVLAVLAAVGLPTDKCTAMLPILDKRGRIPPEAFEEMCGNIGLTADQIGRISRFQDSHTLAEAAAQIGPDPAVQAEIDRLDRIIQTLKTMGVADYLHLDLHVVRGLAYYTGVVYEAFDAEQLLRALAGGGRYDKLLEVLGGPAVGATGFGMGDITLGILLAEKGKLPDLAERCDCYVIDTAEEYFQSALEIVAQLRRAGVSAAFSYKRQGVGKQLKAASQKAARKVILVGAEADSSFGFSKPAGPHQIGVKDLATGEQTYMQLDEKTFEELTKNLLAGRSPSKQMH